MEWKEPMSVLRCLTSLTEFGSAPQLSGLVQAASTYRHPHHGTRSDQSAIWLTVKKGELEGKEVVTHPAEQIIGTCGLGMKRTNFLIQKHLFFVNLKHFTCKRKRTMMESH